MNLSLKDDFLEALNSVKKDFLKDSESSGSDESARQPQDGGFLARETPPDSGEEFPVPSFPDDFVLGAFRQASAIDENDKGEADADDGAHLHNNDDDDDGAFSTAAASLPTFRSYHPGAGAPAHSAEDAPSAAGFEDGRRTYGFGQPDLYGNDKTVISKNTIIRGTVQTEDSLRLMGQVLGDIECKSNIVIAGKVRGNTTAANAYVMDAQVDGSLQCDDVISISSDAWVLGNIRAQQADIDGKVKGNLDIRQTVSIGENSSIIGNISTDELEIQRGAFVNGQIMMYTPSRDVLDKFDHFEK